VPMPSAHRPRSVKMTFSPRRLSSYGQVIDKDQ
jgi:hypothetical protein